MQTIEAKPKRRWLLPLRCCTSVLTDSGLAAEPGNLPHQLATSAPDRQTLERCRQHPKRLRLVQFARFSKKWRFSAFFLQRGSVGVPCRCSSHDGAARLGRSLVCRQWECCQPVAKQ